MRDLIIAIDGPSGAGKGTVARNLAARLGYRHVDTGAMYRAVAWKAVEDGLDLDDERAVSKLAATLSLIATGRTVSVDGRDVTRDNPYAGDRRGRRTSGATAGSPRRPDSAAA